MPNEGLNPIPKNNQLRPEANGNQKGSKLKALRHKAMQTLTAGSMALLSACGLTKDEIAQMPLTRVEQIMAHPRSFSSKDFVKVEGHIEDLGEKEEYVLAKTSENNIGWPTRQIHSYNLYSGTDKKSGHIGVVKFQEENDDDTGIADAIDVVLDIVKTHSDSAKKGIPMENTYQVLGRVILVKAKRSDTYQYVLKLEKISRTDLENPVTPVKKD